MIIKYNNLIMKYEGKWLNTNVTPTPTPPTPEFEEVIIGTQTWTKTNLAIDDGGDGIYVVNNVYANGVNMGTQYYYNWAAANRVVSNISGWHLPTKDEWNTLINYVGGRRSAPKLKSTTGWTPYNNNASTDDYGFSAYPVGVIDNVGFSSAGIVTRYWFSNNPSYSAISLYYSSDLISDGGDYEDFGISIRLIKDT